MSCSVTSLSNTLARCGRFSIGRVSDGEVGDDTLLRGMISDIFQSFG